jgi:hypothetical protein
MRNCELILAGDPRTGKVPGARRPAVGIEVQEGFESL